MNVKKLLAINYYYPPVKAIGSRRNVNICNVFCKLIRPDEFLILSTKNKYVSRDRVLVKHQPFLVPTMDIFSYRHFKRFLINKKRIFQQSNKNIKKNEVLSDETQLKLSKFNKTLLGNLILGEGGFLYIFMGFLKGVKFVNNNSIIFSSYAPLSDHLVAWLLKLFHPKSIWVADFRDLYLQDGVNNVYYFKFHKYLLKQILKKADLVTTVSQGLALPLSKFAKNVSVLRNGIDYNKIPKANKRVTGKFTITYTGGLYGLARDPTPILSAIENALSKGKIERQNITVNYAGLEGDLWNSLAFKCGLSDITQNHGYISQDKALELQKNSNINVVITWSDKYNKGILTGKFFEYIESGNLILVLVRGERDTEFENIVAEANVGACFHQNDVLIMEKWILNVYDEWRANGFNSVNYNYDLLKNFTWENQITNAVIEKLNIERPTDINRLESACK